MIGGDKLKRLDTFLGSLLLSGIVWVAVVFLGYSLTPPETYQAFYGGLIPLTLFGVSGGLAALDSYLLTQAILRSPRLDPVRIVPRYLIAVLFAACLCAIIIYLGVGYMVQHPARHSGIE